MQSRFELRGTQLLHDGKELQAEQEDGSPISACDILYMVPSQDGACVVTCDKDGHVRVWVPGKVLVRCYYVTSVKDAPLTALGIDAAKGVIVASRDDVRVFGPGPDGYSFAARYLSNASQSQGLTALCFPQCPQGLQKKGSTWSSLQIVCVLPPEQ